MGADPDTPHFPSLLLSSAGWVRGRGIPDSVGIPMRCATCLSCLTHLGRCSSKRLGNQHEIAVVAPDPLRVKFDQHSGNMVLHWEDSLSRDRVLLSQALAWIPVGKSITSEVLTCCRVVDAWRHHHAGRRSTIPGGHDIGEDWEHGGRDPDECEACCGGGIVSVLYPTGHHEKTCEECDGTGWQQD